MITFNIKLPDGFKLISKKKNLPRFSCSVIDETAQTIYVFGGLIGKKCSNSFFQYIIPENKWIKLSVPKEVTPRIGHQLLYYKKKHQIYILGGISGNDFDKIEIEGICCEDNWIYDINTKSWIKIPNDILDLKRVNFNALLDNEREKIYIISGFECINCKLISGFADSIYEYDINNKKLTKIISHPRIKRAGSTAVLCPPKNLIIIYGGFIQKKNVKGGIGFNDLVIIDPVRKKIRKIVNLYNITPRSFAFSFWDDDKEVMFIYGGLHGGYESSHILWYYIPQDNYIEAVPWYDKKKFYHDDNYSLTYDSKRKIIYFLTRINCDIKKNTTYLISYSIKNFLSKIRKR